MIIAGWEVSSTTHVLSQCETFHSADEYHNYALYPNRSNLDPWDQYSDLQIWEALEKTHIKEMVSDKMIAS